MESQASALTATSAITHEMEKAKSTLSITDNLPVYIKELIAGGVAGGFAKTAVAPLERLKILFQTRAGNFQRLGISRSLISISQTEGFRGFYRGNGASVVRIVPYAALHFMTYEQYRRWLLVNCPSAGTGPVVDLLAGALAGGTSVLCTYPLDFVRTRLAYQVPNTSKTASVKFHAYTGIRDVISSIYQQRGLRGLYRGLAPTLYGILPYAGLKFYVYESLKGYLTTEQESSLLVKLGCGALAGLIGQTFTYPLDVVRRQMQVDEAFFASNKTSQGIPYKGTVDGLKYIARTQGWRQMFAGLSINYVKIIPSVAIGFVAYDGMKARLRVPPRQKSFTKFSEDEENIKK